MGLECFLWSSIVSGEVEGLEPVIPDFSRGVFTNGALKRESQRGAGRRCCEGAAAQDDERTETDER